MLKFFAFSRFRVVVAFLSLSCASCSYLQSATELFSSEQNASVESSADGTASDAAPSKTSTLSLQPAQPSTSDIEIVWQIPSEPVEGFIIHYGENKSKLSQQVKIESSKIEKIEDPKYGFVYRYVLKDTPANKDTFVSISAFNGTTVSPMGEVFSVPPIQ